MDSVSIQLRNQSLWNEFHQQNTEMILTPQGRQLFPVPEFDITGLQPKAKYAVSLKFALVHPYRMRHNPSENVWNETVKKIAVDSAEPVAPGPSGLGAQLMEAPISFKKTRVSNVDGKLAEVGEAPPVLASASSKRKTTKVKDRPHLLCSLQKYVLEVFVHLIPADGESQLVASKIFPETAFVTVTAYQNPMMKVFKTRHNPHAHARASKPGTKKNPALDTATGTPKQRRLSRTTRDEETSESDVESNELRSTSDEEAMEEASTNPGKRPCTSARKKQGSISGFDASASSMSPLNSTMTPTAELNGNVRRSPVAFSASSTTGSQVQEHDRIQQLQSLRLTTASAVDGGSAEAQQVQSESCFQRLDGSFGSIHEWIKNLDSGNAADSLSAMNIDSGTSVVVPDIELSHDYPKPPPSNLVHALPTITRSPTMPDPHAQPAIARTRRSSTKIVPVANDGYTTSDSMQTDTVSTTASVSKSCLPNSGSVGCSGPGCCKLKSEPAAAPAAAAKMPISCIPDMIPFLTRVVLFNPANWTCFQTTHEGESNLEMAITDKGAPMRPSPQILVEGLSEHYAYSMTLIFQPLDNNTTWILCGPKWIPTGVPSPHARPVECNHGFGICSADVWAKSHVNFSNILLCNAQTYPQADFERLPQFLYVQLQPYVRYQLAVKVSMFPKHRGCCPHFQNTVLPTFPPFLVEHTKFFAVPGQSTLSIDEE